MTYVDINCYESGYSASQALWDLMTQESPSIDVTFGRKDRKWLYGGAGLKFGGIFESVHYKGYGKNIYSETVIGLNLFVGVRFPTW